jgi:hypothetical protein
VGAYIHVFFASKLVGEWSASRPGRFTAGERSPGNRGIGGRVCPRTGVDDVNRRKMLPLENSTPTPRPFSPQPVAILRYPSSQNKKRVNGK